MTPSRVEAGSSDLLERLQPVTRVESLAHQAYELLRHEILFGSLGTVDRLVEHELAARYRMSRTPVREALQRLSLAGLIMLHPAGGYALRRMSRRTVREVFELRRLLEGHAAELACRSSSSGGLDELESLAGVADQQTARPSGFHAALANGSGNRALIRVSGWLNSLVASLPTSSESGEGARRTVSHVEIVAAMRSRDAALARARVEQHLLAAQRLALDRIDFPIPLPATPARSNQGALPLRRSVWMGQSRPSLGDAAYHEMRSAILDGRLPAGRVLSEGVIGSDLGISRTPVRRALQRLELEGYLARDAGGRPIVNHLSWEDIRDVYVLRELLEGYAARLAAERISDRELEELEALAAQDAEALQRGRIDRVAEVNRQFHALLIQAARNRTLYEVAVDLRERLYGGLTAFAIRNAQDRARFVDEHRAILRLLREGEAEGAESMVRTHLRRARELSLARLAHRLGVALEVAGGQGS